jgi:hypothetical protein
MLIGPQSRQPTHPNSIFHVRFIPSRKTVVVLTANLFVLATGLFLMPVETAQSQPLCLVVGQFENRDGASDFSAIASASGSNTSTSKFVDAAGSSWWIVQVGPHSTMDRARNARIDVTRRLGLRNDLAITECETGGPLPATHR